MAFKMKYIGQYPPNDNVKSVLEKTLEANDFKDCQIDIKPLGVKGDNFVAEMYTADVKAVNDGRLNLVIKIGQENEEVRRKTLTPVLFRNEVLTYTQTLPIYEEIQISCNIDENKRYKFAKCYESDLTLGKECIILENLTPQGYSMKNRFEELSYKYVKAAVENLAKYHALSFVFREKYEEKYTMVVQTMRDFFSLCTKNDTMIENFKERFERAAETVTDEDHKERLINVLDKIVDLFLHSHRPWSERTCVISHGDSWLNNILFRKNNGSHLDTIMVDYQLAKHSSPVLDILYFIFLSTDGALREQHFDDLKNAYYDSLSGFLNDLGYDADKFYTRDQMERDIVEYSPYILGSAIVILPVLTGEKDVVRDSIKAEDPKTKTENSATCYHEKMGDIIRDFIKFKFI